MLQKWFIRSDIKYFIVWRYQRLFIHFPVNPQFQYYHYKHNNMRLLVNTRSHSLEHLLTRKMARSYRTGCLTVSNWLQPFTSMYEYLSTCLLTLGPFCPFFPFCWMCNILISVLICTFLRTNRVVCPFICVLVIQLSSFVKYMKMFAHCVLHAPSPTLWPPPILSHFVYSININSHWQNPNPTPDPGVLK